MTAHTDARPFADLHACPNCGAHRWTHGSLDGRYLSGLFRCRECNGQYERHRLVSN